MEIISNTIITYKKGIPVVLQEIKDKYTKFCVQYGGNGHYFTSEAEALTYMKTRKFI